MKKILLITATFMATSVWAEFNEYKVCDSYNKVTTQMDMEKIELCVESYLEAGWSLYGVPFADSVIVYQALVR